MAHWSRHTGGLGARHICGMRIIEYLLPAEDKRWKSNTKALLHSSSLCRFHNNLWTTDFCKEKGGPFSGRDRDIYRRAWMGDDNNHCGCSRCRVGQHFGLHWHFKKL